MKTFRERDPAPIALIGVALTLIAVVAALQYDRLPLFDGTDTYQADFAEAGGLEVGDDVSVSGMPVGDVEGITLRGTSVRVTFSVDRSVRLGRDTRAAITTVSALGERGLAVTPDGPGALDSDDVIPLDNTRSPYSLTDALGRLSDTVEATDTAQLDESLRTLSDTMAAVDPGLDRALDGVSRLSRTVASRDESLRALLHRAKDVTAILERRSDRMNALLVDADLILGELQRRRDDLAGLITHVNSLSQQLSGLVADTQDSLTPTLQKLDSVLDMLNTRRDDIAAAIENLVPYSRALGESVSNGPFFLAYVQNVLPEANLAPLIDLLVPPNGGD